MVYVRIIDNKGKLDAGTRHEVVTGNT